MCAKFLFGNHEDDESLIIIIRNGNSITVEDFKERDKSNYLN
ncbi:hypothetical protein [Aquimarina sp. SS2-1]